MLFWKKAVECSFRLWVCTMIRISSWNQRNLILNALARQIEGISDHTLIFLLVKDRETALVGFGVPKKGEEIKHLFSGARFGLLQSKVGLALLLRQYQFFVNKTKTPTPLKYKVNSIFLAVEGGIWLDTQKI